MQWGGGRKSEGHTALVEERHKMDREWKAIAASTLKWITENLNLRVYPTSPHDAPYPTQTKLTKYRMLTLFPHFPLSRWTRSDPPPMELLMLSRTQAFPAPGILGEQVGFSWSNRPCTPDTPKSQMEARAWDPQPNLSSKHNDYTMVCDHGHRNPPCRPFSGRLQWVLPPKQWTVYRDGLYAINHGEFVPKLQWPQPRWA